MNTHLSADPDHETILLDGGMGRELQFRGVNLSPVIWAAIGLIEAPGVVKQIHMDYIRAGAQIITANTYSIIRSDLQKIGLDHRFLDLHLLACRLAADARKETNSQVLIAGSLPPLGGSFRPDLVPPPDQLKKTYNEHVDILTPHVDMFICETMSTAAEARAAVECACVSNKPVWVSWTLHEDQSGNLRSGETIQEAISALEGLPIQGCLVNCCAPESVTAAIPKLKSATSVKIGGYANTFEPIPPDWTLDGKNLTDGLLPLRKDLTPEEYGIHVKEWLQNGATIVGGCCGTRPDHIRHLRKLLKQLS